MIEPGLNLKHLRQVYRLNEIQRYNPWQKIKSETVASHSFYVSYFTLLICEKLDLRKDWQLKMLKAAIVHDIPEVITNDITYDAKKSIKGLSKAEKDFSDNILVTKYNINPSVFCEYLVKFADLLSVIQFTANEILLGNKTLEEMMIGAFERGLFVIKVISSRIDFYQPLYDILLNLLDDIIEKGEFQCQ